MTDTIEITASTYTVGAGDVLQFDDQYGFLVDGAGPSGLISRGQVTVDYAGSGQQAVGLLDQSSAPLTIALRASSVFTVSNRGSAGATGFVLSGSGSSLINAGDLVVRGGAGETAILAVDPGVSGVRFVNSGQIDARTTGMLDALRLGDGSEFHNRGDITLVGGEDVSYGVVATRVHNDGTIGFNGGMEAIGVQARSFTNSGHLTVSADFLVDAVEVTGGSFSNTGTISAHTLDGDEVAVFIGRSGGAPGLVDNAGVLKGLTALESLSAVTATNSGKIFGEINLGEVSSLSNTGLIRGGVIMDGTLANSGRIVGDIDLLDGADHYDGAHGKLIGTLAGGGGDDILTGGRLGELIYGDGFGRSSSDGADLISGGKGDDSLHGGDGADTLDGGAGDDSFVFGRLSDSTPGAGDTIVKLTAHDLIDLHGIDADTGHGGDQAFHLVSALSGQAGELALSYDAGTNTTTLAGDVDGDGEADLQVTIGGDASGFTHFAL